MSRPVEEILEFDKIKSKLRSLCSTNKGKQLVDELSPLQDKPSIEYRLNLTREVMEWRHQHGELPIPSDEEVLKLLQSLDKGDPPSVEQLLAFVSWADGINELKRLFTKEFPLLYELGASILPVDVPANKIRQHIDENGVKPSSSPKLMSILRRIRELEEAIRYKLSDYLQLPYLQEPIIVQRLGRYVIPVKMGAQSKIRGITIALSATEHTAFVEPMDVLHLNNELLELQKEKEVEELRIILEIMDELRATRLPIEHDLILMGKLDLTNAKAKLAHEMDARIPKIVEPGNPLIMREARHPLLIYQKEVVPLDIEVGKDFTLLLITGPNMGGKTVALKTVGLISLMVLSGIPAPLSEDSEIPIWDRIFVDIGEELPVGYDLSTSSAHIEGLKTIYQEATSRSLALIDEIGRGTDPEEGSALGFAFMERFVAKGIKTLVTTHYSKLKVWVANANGMENGAMGFRDGVPTYRLTIGTASSSYGLELASRLRVPEIILKRAYSLMDPKTMRLDQLLRTLEEQRTYWEMKHRELLEKEATLKSKEATLSIREEKARNIIREAAKIKREALLEGRAIIENLIREIREHQASKESIRKVKSTIHKLLEPVAEDEPVHPHTLNKGDKVLVKTLGIYGKIEDIKDDEAIVRINNVTLRLKPAYLEKVTTHEVEHPKVKLKLSHKRDLPLVLDLHGVTREEALRRLDKYIDDAQLLGVEMFKISHGIGKGILLTAIRERLAKDPRVASFAPGAPAEGGDGVTWVYLKPISETQ